MQAEFGKGATSTVRPVTLKIGQGQSEVGQVQQHLTSPRVHRQVLISSDLDEMRVAESCHVLLMQ